MLKAFAVTEDYDNNGAIVFAERDIEARKWGMNEFGCDRLGGLTCKRAHWADSYAGKTVPAWLMIENGWNFECCGCGSKIDLDYLDDEDLPLDGVIGTQHSRVFCSPICEARQRLHDAFKTYHEHRSIDALKIFVLKRFPSVLIRADGNWLPRAYASKSSDGSSWQVEQCVGSFDFPGMKIGPATCRIERRQGVFGSLIGPILPQFQCCYGDKDTFELWVRSPESRSKIT